MILRGAGPEDAHVLLDLLVGDARVVGGATLGGHPQLVEDVLGAREVVEVLAPAQAVGDLHHDLPVGPGISGAVHGLVDLDDAALGAGGGALVLLVQGRGEHDVRVLGGLARGRSPGRRRTPACSRASRVKLGVRQATPAG